VDEFGMVLADIKNKNTGSHMKMCAKVLTELYSASNGVYYGGQYADVNRPPIRIHSPNLCVYGTTTLAKYIEAMDKSVITSGELNRYIVLNPAIEFPDRVKGGRRKKARAEIVDAWRSLKPGGPSAADTDTPLEVTWDWQDERIYQIQLFQDRKIQAPVTGPLWARYAENVIKLAMIMAIARKPAKPNIEGTDLDKAEDLVKRSVVYMTELANTEMYDSDHQRDCNRVLDVIKKFGERMPKMELSNRTREMKSQGRDGVLLALEERGAIKIEKSENTVTRPIYYVTAL
jgi:hypothetical protein